MLEGSLEIALSYNASNKLDFKEAAFWYVSNWLRRERNCSCPEHDNEISCPIKMDIFLISSAAIRF
jgi:hypothetical protein